MSEEISPLLSAIALGVGSLAFLVSFRLYRFSPSKSKNIVLSLPELVVDAVVIEPEDVISEKIFPAPECAMVSL